MAFGGVAKDIYVEFFSVLENNSTFDYIRTKQRGFYPRDPSALNPKLFPWVFIEFGGMTDIEVRAAPRNWKYQFILQCVALTFADKGDPTDLVYNDGTSDNKGIGDLVTDIMDVYWTTKKVSYFDVSGVRDWTIGRVGVPSVLGVQQMLINPLVRGVQLDFAFEIIERT